MASSVEAARMMRALAPPTEGANIKARIAKAARALGWGHSRAKDVWYADPRVRVSATEMDALRRKAKQEATDNADRLEIARLERLAAAMEQTDPEAFGPDIHALRSVVRSYRRVLGEVK